MTVNKHLDSISILSHNTTGWNSYKADFIKNLVISKNVDVIAIQEHFLLKQNMVKIQEQFSGFELFALPAFKNDTKITAGRPSGGLALLYRNHLNSSISRISCPNSNRVHGIKLSFQNDSYVFINVYFPVDKRNQNIDDLICVLQDVKFILDQVTDQCKVVLLGDLNCDFNRDSFFVNHIKEFISENNLQSVWSKFDCDFSYNHTRNIQGVDTTCFSVIDHFCVSKHFINDCIAAFPVHSQDNLSNHVPIYLKFHCNSIGKVDETPADLGNRGSRKPIWDRASETDLHNYKIHLQQLVNTLVVPVDSTNCTDIHCNHVHCST